METIYIGFSKSTKKFAWFSWLIRLVDGTEYSHVYIKFHSNSLERDIIYQASGTQVNFVGTKIFESCNKVVIEYPLDIKEETKKRILQQAIDKAGIPYGIKEIFGLAIIKLYSLFGKKISNPFGNRDITYVCCELVADLLTEQGILSIKDIESITPKDLEVYIKELSNNGKTNI